MMQTICRLLMHQRFSCRSVARRIRDTERLIEAKLRFQARVTWVTGLRSPGDFTMKFTVKN